VSLTAGQLITNALLELGAYAQGETPSAEDMAYGLSKLNRLLDQWNARRLYVYSIGFNTYNLTANVQIYLIGPTGAFVVVQRPVEIIAANIVLTNTSPTTRTPMNIRDDAWWANQRVRSVTSTVPTDLYYSPDWPNGSIILWPIPSAAYQLEIETWGLLGQMTNTASTFSLPPGYEEAVTLTLAEVMAPAFGLQVSSGIASQAMRARATIQSLNSAPPRIRTADPAMPGPGRNGFNYLTGDID
jgi:hypothetical protein